MVPHTHTKKTATIYDMISAIVGYEKKLNLQKNYSSTGDKCMNHRKVYRCVEHTKEGNETDFGQ
jgi:hypothetical protein